MAAVRALRPKRDRLRLSCADASSENVVTRIKRQSRLAKTLRMLTLLLLFRINSD
jgi:hypothetical protein